VPLGSDHRTGRAGRLPFTPCGYRDISLNYVELAWPALEVITRGVRAVSSPFTRCGRWSRRTSLALASLIVLTPCAILTATLPGNGNNGFIDIGSFWLWQKKGMLRPPVNAGSCGKLRNHGGYFPSGNWISACLTSVPRHPDILINGSDVRKILVIICGLLAVAMVGAALANHDDHGLLFGSATVFFALTAVAACVSVFARKHRPA
jgi:hypothetical protein